MPPDERRILEMVEAMRVEGGGFAKALAECFVHADPENRRRLLRTFPEYVAQYLRRAGDRRFAKNPGPGRVQP